MERGKDIWRDGRMCEGYAKCVRDMKIFVRDMWRFVRSMWRFVRDRGSDTLCT